MKSHKELWFLLQDTSCQIGVTSLLFTLMHVWQELQKPQLLAASRDQTLKSSPGPTGQLPLPSAHRKSNCSDRISDTSAEQLSHATGICGGIGGIWHSGDEMRLSGVSEQHKHCGDFKAWHMFNSCFTGEWNTSEQPDSPPQRHQPAPTWADSSLSKKEFQLSHSSKPTRRQTKIFQG